MKRNLLYTLFFLYGVGMAFSQNITFPKNEAVWKEEHITFIGPVLKHAALCGDTLINASVYSKVVQLQLDANGTVTGKTYLGGLRTGGEIVRFLPDFDTNEHLLYDFSLKQGDVIDLAAYYFSTPVTRKVESVTMELLAGKQRKVIYFSPGDPNAPQEFWVEGIGSNYGLLGRASYPGGDIGFSLLCFRHEDDYLSLITTDCNLPALENCGTVNASKDVPRYYPAFSLSPNPSSGDVKVSVKSAALASGQVRVYASNGQLLKTIEAPASSLAVIPAGSLTPGLYLLELIDKATGERLGSERLIILR